MNRYCAKHNYTGTEHCPGCVTSDTYQIPGPYAPIDSVESCPSCSRYAAGVDLLTKEIRAKDALLEEVCEERDRLKGAVEWACEHAEDFGKLYVGEYDVSGFASELRRRAGCQNE